MPSPGEFHASLKAKGRGAKGWANSWSEVEYLGVDEQGREKFAATISVGHKVFKDKTDGQWKTHKLTDERLQKDYILVQSAKCCVEVYPNYAKIFDVDHEEVRLHEERWVVQRLFREPDTWRDIDAYNPVVTIGETQNSITVTITYDSDYGPLAIKYIQRDGRQLKHEIIFTNTTDNIETFRVLQRWAGIVGAKCNNKTVPHTITTAEEAARIEFQSEDGRFTLGENLWNMIFDPDSEDREEKTNQCLQRPITVESHARGMKADFIYGFWTLDQNGILEIDPSTYSNSNPLQDGDIKYSVGVYTRDSSDTKIVVRYNSSTGAKIRGYADWSTAAVPDSSSITDVDFIYGCYRHEGDCHIHERDSQYTVGDSTLYADCGSDTVYADPAGFPVLGTGQTVDLGASANVDLEAQLGADWFAIGIQKDSESSDGKNWIYSEESAYDPTLYVTYTAGVSIPTVTTQDATDLNIGQGRLNGTITATGGENADERGFDWDYNSGTPYAYDETDLGSFGVGAFNELLTGLTQAETVYFRGKAHNSAGWGYGSEKSFRVRKAWYQTLEDTVELSDELSRATNYGILLEDGIGVVDEIGGLATLKKLLEDTAKVDDILIKTVDFKKLLTDNVKLSDEITAGIRLLLTDVVEVNDELTKSSEFHKLLGDMVETLDELVTKIAVSLEDTVEVEDILSKIASFKKTFTDTSELADELSTISDYRKLLEDEVETSDFLQKVATFHLALEDSLLVVDALTKIASFHLMHEDTIIVSDVIITAIALTLIDEVNVSDTLTKTTFFKKILEDVVEVSDVITTAIATTLIDNIYAMDEISKTTSFKKSLIDGVKVTDALSQILTFHVSLEDEVELSDLLTKVAVFYVSVEDTATVVDTLIKVTSFHLALEDSVEVEDLLSKLTDFHKTLTDAIQLSDALEKMSAFCVTLKDTATVIDALSKTTVFKKLLSDAVLVSDEIIIWKTWHGIVVVLNLRTRKLDALIKSRGLDLKIRKRG